MKIEDNGHAYKGEDGFLRLSTSFGKSLHYEVLSFVYLTVRKQIDSGWVQGGVAMPFSC